MYAEINAAQQMLLAIDLDMADLTSNVIFILGWKITLYVPDHSCAQCKQ